MVFEFSVNLKIHIKYEVLILALRKISQSLFCWFLNQNTFKRRKKKYIYINIQNSCHTLVWTFLIRYQILIVCIDQINATFIETDTLLQPLHLRWWDICGQGWVHACYKILRVTVHMSTMWSPDTLYSIHYCSVSDHKTAHNSTIWVLVCFQRSDTSGMQCSADVSVSGTWVQGNVRNYNMNMHSQP